MPVYQPRAELATGDHKRVFCHLDKATDGLVDAFQRIDEVGTRAILGQLPADVTLAKPEQELRGRLLVDLLSSGACIQLGEQGQELGRRLARLDEMGPKGPVQLAVEVLRRQLRE